MRSWVHGLLLSTSAADTILPRQSGCTNQTNIETDIGLAFDNYCLTNIPDYDLRNHDTDTFAECLEACATSAADPGQAPCRAVAYNTQVRRCWQKSGNATRGELVPAENTIMAFANDRAWLNAGHTCPYTNGSIQTDSNGLQYEILCGIRHKGDNFDPKVDEDYQPFHATSMEECLDYCSQNSPLCYGVLYSEGLDIGYRNCWPKTKNATSDTSGLVPDGGATTAIALLSVNSTCSGSSYNTANGAVFDTSCDMSGSGPDLKKIHANNFGECIDECANYRPQNGNSECRNVIYQPDSQAGYLNCYLKYGLDNTTSQAQWHMAALTSQSSGSGDGADDNSSSPSNGNVTAGDSSSDSDNNTGLVVGAVVGPVAGIALIAGLFFWWRRRRRAALQEHNATNKTESEPLGKALPPSPYMSQEHTSMSMKKDHYSQYSSSGGTVTSSPQQPLVEMGGGRRDVKELPGSETPRYEMQA